MQRWWELGCSTPPARSPPRSYSNCRLHPSAVQSSNFGVHSDPASPFHEGHTALLNYAKVSPALSASRNKVT